MTECYDGYQSYLFQLLFTKTVNSQMLISTPERTQMLIKHKDLPQQIRVYMW